MLGTLTPVCLVCLMTVMAEDRMPSASSFELRAQLTVDTGACVLGTPLLARADLIHAGEKAITVLWRVPLPTLLVAKEDGEFSEKEFAGILASGPRRDREVAPGERLGGADMRICIDYWRMKREDPFFIFPEPGRYRLKLEWCVYVKREGNTERVFVPSNEVTVDVLPPAPGFAEYEAFLRKDSSWREAEKENFLRSQPAGLYSCVVKSAILSHWTESKDWSELIREVQSSERLAGYARDILKEVGLSRREMSDRALYVLVFAGNVAADRGPEAEREAHAQEAADCLGQLERNFPKTELLERLKSLPDILAAWPK
jgi:hypothetical protein